MVPPKAERKLAAVLAADVAGYTRLMDADEDATMATWWSHRQELIGATIDEHRGRIVKLTGDGFLAEFPSALDAVSSAVEIQTEVARRNIGVRRERRMEFRMGVNLCDIMADDEDFYGHGVNLAARLEAMAAPGGICVSENIYEQVRHDPELEFESLGEQSLKNIDEPVTVYALRLHLDTPTHETAAPRKSTRGPLAVAFGVIAVVVVAGLVIWGFQGRAPEPASGPVETVAPVTATEVEPKRSPALNVGGKPSIAVLPFTNVSDDPKQEFFVDGMTETLITDLSKISGLYVSSRNSVFAYKGQVVDIQQVADELGVLYVLEGSVQRVGDKVRINAQLIDGYGGGHVWADRYDGVMDDVFALQDEVTRKIATALAVKFSDAETQVSVSKETQSVAAYDAFQHGWGLFQRATAKDLAAAVPHLEKAIEEDPGYSRAFAVLAAVYERAWSRQWHDALGVSPDEALARADQYLQAAMKNPTPLAHVVASTLHSVEGRHGQATQEAERAIELAPEDSGGYFAMAQALIYAGQAAEGMEHMYRAMELEPEYPAEYLTWLGMARFFNGDLDQAALSLDRASKLLPDDATTLAVLAATYGFMGRQRDAQKAIDKLNGLESEAGTGSSVLDVDGWPLKEARDRDRLQEGLRMAGLP